MNCQNTIYCVCLISGSIDTLRICQQSRQQSCQQSCDKHGLVIALLWRTSVVVVITWVTTGSQSGCLPKRHPASPLGAHRSDNPRRYWVLTDVPPCVATGCSPKRQPASLLGTHRCATVRRHYVPTKAPPSVATGCPPKRHPASPLGAHRNATPRRHWVLTKSPPRVAPFGAGVPLHVPVYQEQKDLHKTRLFYS